MSPPSEVPDFYYGRENDLARELLAYCRQSASMISDPVLLEQMLDELCTSDESRSKKRVKTNSESTEIPQPTCHGCADRQCMAGPSAQEPVVQGSRLVLASAACFLAPLVLALVGAALFRYSPTAQLFGAVAGLVVGMLSWGLVARTFEIAEEAA